MASTLKVSSIIVLSAVLILLAVLVTRATLTQPEPFSAAPASPIPLDESGAIQRFVGAIRIPTESQSGQPPNPAAMLAMRSYLEQSFPRVHATLKREVLPDGALLYTWTGRDTTKDPVILMGHMDVVPAAAETLDQWKHPPYSGDIAEGFIWGRGTMDDKVHVLSLLEATETLLARGFTPTRTILLAFGCDEENGGHYGAREILDLLQSRHTRAEFVLDEGGLVATGAIPGLARPVAAVGISEKGYVDLALTTHAPGGHSSAPPPRTAIGELSTALSHLEAHPFPTSMPGVVRDQYASLAPYMPFGRRLILSNLWLFKPLIIQSSRDNLELASALHTTTAETMFNAGFKENALPTSARAVVNFRILPGETAESVQEHVRQTINDSGVSIAIANAGNTRNPSPVSPQDSLGYRTLSMTIHQFFSRCHHHSRTSSPAAPTRAITPHSARTSIASSPSKATSA